MLAGGDIARVVLSLAACTGSAILHRAVCWGNMGLFSPALFAEGVTVPAGEGWLSHSPAVPRVSQKVNEAVLARGVGKFMRSWAGHIPPVILVELVLIQI